MNMTKWVKWDGLMGTSLGGMLVVNSGGPFQPVSQTYLCGLDPSRGRDTHTGFDYKRPKQGAVATQVQRVSYACVDPGW